MKSSNYQNWMETYKLEKKFLLVHAIKIHQGISSQEKGKTNSTDTCCKKISLLFTLPLLKNQIPIYLPSNELK